MDIGTETWFKRLREDAYGKPVPLNEMTEEGADKTFEFMAENGPEIQPEFDELFDGAMRVAIPLVGSDTVKILELVNIFKEEGWHPPTLRGPAGISIQAFATKKVKEKRRALAADGGGVTEVEIEVAALNLERTYDFEIPAGPRKGEKIEKTDKTSMSKAITKGVKQGLISPELNKWWQKKQTFFSKDPDGWGTIENAFTDQISDEWRVIISRHPVDVLRMSDIGDISSCHREGGEYFKCAVEESLGNGLIAYLVRTDDLADFLSETPALTKANKLIKTEILEKSGPYNIFGKHLNDSEAFKRYLEIWKESIAYHYRDWDDVDEIFELINYDTVQDAIRAKLDGKEQPKEDTNLKPLNEFDTQEIFHDSDRDVKGIKASSRVRLRKFYDSKNDKWFTAPGLRTYGRNISRFQTAVAEWAAEKQKDLFVEGDELVLPAPNNLTRYGGSYEDLSDGKLLNALFRNMGARTTPYGDNRNVAHEHSEEGDSRDDLFDQMEEELGEVLRGINNRVSHMHFSAEVTDELDVDPFVYGSADVVFEIDIGWEGPVDRNEESGFFHFPEDDSDKSLLPMRWWGPHGSALMNLLRELSDSDPAEINWEVDLDSNLRIFMNFSFDVDGVTPEDYDGWADYYISSIDDEYTEIHEKIRRRLVEEEYIAPTPLDLLIKRFREEDESHPDGSMPEFDNWIVEGYDEDDYRGVLEFRFWPDQRMSKISTGIMLPKSFGEMGHTPGFGESTAIKNVFGISVNRDEHTQMFIAPPYFKDYLADQLIDLEEAAYNQALAQTQLDFGEQYERAIVPPEKLKFASNVELVIGVNSDNKDEHELYFRLGMKLNKISTNQEVMFVFDFMKFIDKYPTQVIIAVKAGLQNLVEERLEALSAKDKRYLDGTFAKKFIEKIEKSWNKKVQHGGLARPHHAVMALTSFIKHFWDQFDKPEKYAAIDYYLRPLINLSDSPRRLWGYGAEDTGIPSRWEERVKTVRHQLNVFQADNYKWTKGFLKAPPLKEPESAASRLGLLDAGESPTIRGTLGEPIPVGYRGPANESIEAQISRVDSMLKEGSIGGGREPIDLRIYKVSLGCVINLDLAGTDSQIENQIRGIKEVTTVSHNAKLQKRVGPRQLFRVYDIKFELYGQKARDTYRDSALVPAMNRDVKGVKVVDRGPVETFDNIQEWGGMGYAPQAPTPSVPIPTPAVSLQSVLDDWVEGGVQVYDAPMNTNQMQYHVMMQVEDLWQHCNKFFSGTKTDFDGKYKNFIRSGAQQPVYIALGQNGRVKVTGGEDLIWFAKQSGLTELPVFFSYQKQV